MVKIKEKEEKEMPSLDFGTERSEFYEWYRKNYPILQVAEKTYRNLILLLLSNINGFPTPKVLSRLKERDECISKFRRKYQADFEEKKEGYTIKENLVDIIGIRVICLYESDIEKICEILEDNFDIVSKTDVTGQLRSKEDRFGYQGLHLDIKLNKKRKELPEYVGLPEFTFEVQVRTITQDAWSEIDHKLRYKKDLPPDLTRKIYALAGMFEIADKEFEAVRKETALFLQKQQDTQADKDDELLSPFNFFRVMRGYYPAYYFPEYQLEGFVSQIRACKEDITIGEFKEAFNNYYKRVEEYRNWMIENRGLNLNPYTTARHVLLRHDENIFGSLVFDRQRNNFNRWEAGRFNS